MATRIIGKRRAPRAQRSRKKKALLAGLMAGVAPGFVLFSAYLASFMGEGLGHLLLSLALLLVIPFITIFKLLGRQPHRAGKTLALWGAISWLFTVVVLLGSMERTGEVLKRHGAWFTSVFGKSQRKRGDALAKRLVETLPVEKGIPYRFEEGSIIVAGEASNGHRKKAVRFVLDTGASISTISSSLAASLGLGQGLATPLIEVQTASGSARYPLVTLDAITLPGGRTVGPITAAICDACGGKKTQGLLGLNFTSHFHIAINSKEAVVKLKKRSGWIDQKGDVEPFLAINNLTGDLTRERFLVAGTLVNTATKPMQGVVLECIVKDETEKVIQRKRVKVARLDPATPHPLSLKLAPHQNIGSFHMEIKRAFWTKKSPPTLLSSTH